MSASFRFVAFSILSSEYIKERYMQKYTSFAQLCRKVSWICLILTLRISYSLAGPEFILNGWKVYDPQEEFLRQKVSRSLFLSFYH